MRSAKASARRPPKRSARRSCSTRSRSARQITVTDEDLDAELQRYADQTGHSVASIRARLQKDGELGRLAAGLRREKAVTHVLSKANIKKG